jgi:3-oxoacyl-[acyl-carrier-protein] synthase I
VKLNLVITGVGMLTPVGLNANVSLHSVRSGITRLDIQRYPDRTKQWLSGGRIMYWSGEIRAKRLRYFAELALKQALEQASGGKGAFPLSSAAVVIGMPEVARPGYRFTTDGFVLERWLADMNMDFKGPCEFVEAGHCNGHAGLARAHQLIESGAVRLCVIGAVDTQLQLRVLRWHEDHYRLKCSYMNDALIPGEGSCFIVVESEQSARDREVPQLARLLSTATDREPANILSEQPNTAQGLTRAIRKALIDANLKSAQIQSVWCDLNGESYRAREWAFTEVRLAFQDYTKLIHPADCYGDLGAVSDVVLLGLSSQAQATGWANGQVSLIFTGSEEGIRGATIVGPPGGRHVPSFFPVTEGVPRTIPIQFSIPSLGVDDVKWEETENPAQYYFEWQLRQEHLDDVASIYNQREALLIDPGVEWHRAREPEQRILNHIDAVAASGVTSIWAIGSGMLSDEEGVCFAGALTFGVLPTDQPLTLIDELLERIPSTNLRGIEAGLKHAPHVRLPDHIKLWLTHTAPEVQILAANLAGYQRVGDPEWILSLLDSKHPDVLCAAARALRRFRYLPAMPTLEQLLTHNDPKVLHEIILALLCMGSRAARNRVRNLCQEDCPPEIHCRFLLALCGDRNDVQFLKPQFGNDVSEIDRIQAMGILGSVHTVQDLLHALHSKDEEVRVAAGESLHLLTGAQLREVAVITERVSATEEDNQEGISYEVERVSTSFEAWSSWWSHNQQRFDARQRWRLGNEFNLGLCIAELRDGKSQYVDRQRAYWELVIHSGQNFAFEPDWFVPHQYTAIEQWENWWHEQSRSS